jgi:RsiW-degrading membrane proteinase PrsW (M82 family)
MLAIYIIVALFIAFIWIDYFRRIDIFEKEKWYYYLVVFALGASSVLVVFSISWIMEHFNALQLNGDFWNDFFFCVINIGMVEEFAKSLPFVVIFIFFRRLLNEPLDYLIVFCVSALGFSATENVLYFNNYGSEIIIGRSALAAVGHMFDTALVAYGVILSVYRFRNFGALLIPAFFILAALSHGFYDFWLIYTGVEASGWLVTFIYFMITLSWFSTILNNALNHSPFFTYKKNIKGNKLGITIYAYYIAVFVAQFFMIWYQRSLYFAGKALIGNFLMSIVILVIVFRLSRFKLIKNYWHKFRIESPVSLVLKADGETHLGFKGESSSESEMNMYIEEYLRIKPLSTKHGGLLQPATAYISGKGFTKRLDAVYKIKVFTNDELSEYIDGFLLLKRGGLIFTQKHKRIFLLATFKGEEFEDLKYDRKDFNIIDWVVIDNSEIKDEGIEQEAKPTEDIDIV